MCRMLDKVECSRVACITRAIARVMHGRVGFYSIMQFAIRSTLPPSTLYHPLHSTTLRAIGRTMPPQRGAQLQREATRTPFSTRPSSAGGGPLAHRVIRVDERPAQRAVPRRASTVTRRPGWPWWRLKALCSCPPLVVGVFVRAVASRPDVRAWALAVVGPHTCGVWAQQPGGQAWPRMRSVHACAAHVCTRMRMRGTGASPASATCFCHCVVKSGERRRAAGP